MRPPRWAVPFLAAYLVATASPHYLRQLDDEAFRITARACDSFALATIVPPFAWGLFLLPLDAGLWLLVATSTWGTAFVLAVGRRVALERKRRRQRGR